MALIRIAHRTVDNLQVSISLKRASLPHFLQRAQAFWVCTAVFSFLHYFALMLYRALLTSRAGRRWLAGGLRSSLEVTCSSSTYSPLARFMPWGCLKLARVWEIKHQFHVLLQQMKLGSYKEDERMYPSLSMGLAGLCMHHSTAMLKTKG